MPTISREAPSRGTGVKSAGGRSRQHAHRSKALGAHIMDPPTLTGGGMDKALASNHTRIITLHGPDGREHRLDIYQREGFQALAKLWSRSNWQQKLSYELTWLGIPIIQLPEDILMIQELIYKVRPDVIVETGTAHGGTAVFYASMCELLGKGHVISVDVEIRKYNRLAIQAHPMSHRITLIEGNAIAERVVAQVRQRIQPSDQVMVMLDSNHTYVHVREELRRYGPLVTPGSYLVVFDGVMEILTDAPSGSPTWARDNPSMAVREFLAEDRTFEVDPYYNRLGVTYCPNGFLRRKSADATRQRPHGRGTPHQYRAARL
jgi:cephalosporin hydroxylase